MLRDCTLLFLVKKDQDQVKEICLAMKKRGFGVNKWNGVGGKVEQGESIAEAAKRETKEEINVSAENICKVAELSFFFLEKPEWNNKATVFLSDHWQGEPEESEEMRPQWFSVSDLPFSDMWSDDSIWLPLILNNKKIKAEFSFTGDQVIKNKVTIVDKL